MSNKRGKPEQTQHERKHSVRYTPAAACSNIASSATVAQRRVAHSEQQDPMRPFSTSPLLNDASPSLEFIPETMLSTVVDLVAVVLGGLL